MPIELPTITVAELHAQLTDLVAKGHGNLPACTSDGRARYPFQTFAVPSPAGVLDALLIMPRPDARFAQRDPLPDGWQPECFTYWNELAQEVKDRCGAFADLDQPAGWPSAHVMKRTLERIHDCGHPDAPEHMPELRGISEAGFGEHLVRLAGDALGRT